MENRYSGQIDILAADNARDTVRVVFDMLVKNGFRVRLVSGREHALSAVTAALPDVVLIDIMRPEPDGYAACEQLKAADATRDIPVIFISASHDARDKARGFRSGAADYITAPFEAAEVLSRVRAHLDAHRLRRQVQAQNRQLQQEIAERARAEAALHEANAGKETFFSILAHDLRSPFSGILGSADIALAYFDQLTPDELREHILRIKTSAEKFYALLDNLLVWARIQRGRLDCQPENIPVQDMFAHLIDVFAETAEQKQIVLQQQGTPALTAYADLNMFTTILRNLISNALKFTPGGGCVTLSAGARDRRIEIAVADTGVGIADTEIADVLSLERKTTTPGTAGESGTGLGLPLCRELVEKNQGTLRIESAPQRGTTVTISLPASGSFAGEESAAALLTDAEHVRQLLNRAPADWVSALRQAVELFNLSQTKMLIEAIRPEHPALADALTSYADQFRFEAIEILCRQIIGAPEASE